MTPPADATADDERAHYLEHLELLIGELERHRVSPPISLAAANLYPTEQLPTLLGLTREALITVLRALQGSGE